MTYEHAFSIINLAVMPAWALLVFLPRAGITKALVHSGAYPLLLGLFYIVTICMTLFFGMGAEGGDFSSAAGVSQMFSHPLGILVGWSHYLVFDLFVGAWEARDAQRRGIHHLMLVPCLLLTFIFGPVGLFAYILLRLATRKGGFNLFEA